MFWWNVYILVIGFSLLLALFLTPVFRKISMLINVQDMPLEQTHKQHVTSTPLMGGFAMCTTWCITLLVGAYSPEFLKTQNISEIFIDNLAGIFEVRPRLIAIIGGGILITLLGLIDDKFNMSAKMKFLGQVLISLLVIWYGELRISLFIENFYIQIAISLLWLLIIINSMNFFDNMDGLAVGISAIAFLFFTIVAIIYDHHFEACMSAACLGTTIGFWFYNHTPATIFMGDSGSHFLGYILGVTGILTTYYREGFTTTGMSVLIPLFILAVPLYDFVTVMIIRYKNKKPVYQGDHNHLSHRFWKMGMTKKNAVLCVHLLSILLGMNVLPLLWGNEIIAIICVLQASLLLSLITVLQYSLFVKSKSIDK